MEKLLTVIVPVYNGAPYLKKCLSSFVSPLLTEKLEVIVVDDGSEDETPAIAEFFCKEYPTQFQLLRKKNGGHGSAINAALTLVQGKYLKAVDADDWVITENLQCLLSYLSQTQADVVVTEFDIINIKTNRIQRQKLGCQCGKEILLAQIVEQFPRVYKCFTYHGLFYKTDVYRSAGFLLTEGVFYEDNEYAILPFSKVETILPVALSIYQYRMGDHQQSVAFHNQVRRIGHIAKVTESILDYEEASAIQADKAEYFLLKLAGVVASYYAVALVKNPNKKEGRRMAVAFHEWVYTRRPELGALAERKYRTLWALNRVHFSADFYQRLMDLGLQRFLRNFWGKL